MTIYARFSTVEHDPTCFLIRTVTWSRFSHVDICLPEGLLGARPPKVSIEPYGYQPKARVQYVRCKELSPEEELIAHKFWRDQIGKPYDYLAVAGNLVHRDWKSEDKWFCSELFAAGFLAAAWPLLNEEFLDRVTPGIALLSPRLEACSEKEVFDYLKTAQRQAPKICSGSCYAHI